MLKITLEIDHSNAICCCDLDLFSSYFSVFFLLRALLFEKKTIGAGRTTLVGHLLSELCG